MKHQTMLRNLQDCSKHQTYNFASSLKGLYVVSKIANRCEDRSLVGIVIFCVPKTAQVVNHLAS